MPSDNIATCKGFAWRIIMGSGFDDWVYCHFLTITVYYNSSHIELLLDDVCLTNFYEESLIQLNSRMNSLLKLRENRIEITASKGFSTVLHECVVSENVCPFRSNGLVSKCLQLSIFVSMEPVFRNLSAATYLPVRFLETAHKSQYYGCEFWFH
jgi:hypothetical protein